MGSCMKKALLSILLAAVSLSLPGVTHACDYCLLSQGISPLDTMTGAGIKIGERYSVLDQVYQGTTELTNPGTKETHWTTELTAFYNITPAFMLLAVIPYKNGSTTGEIAQNPDGTLGLNTAGAGRAKGLGDIALLGRYTLLKQENPDMTTILAGIAGVKFSTGKTDAKTFDGMEFLDSHLQPGTGSTDYLLGLSLSHALSRFSVSANLLGTLGTLGEFGNTQHRFGNSLNYDVTAKYRIAPEAFSPTKPQWFAALGLIGELRDRETTEGDPDTYMNSGGNTIYLPPGLQLVLVPHGVIEGS
jgi:hypothetical protein